MSYHGRSDHGRAARASSDPYDFDISEAPPPLADTGIATSGGSSGGGGGSDAVHAPARRMSIEERVAARLAALERERDVSIDVKAADVSGEHAAHGAGGGGGLTDVQSSSD